MQIYNKFVVNGSNWAESSPHNFCSCVCLAFYGLGVEVDGGGEGADAGVSSAASAGAAASGGTSSPLLLSLIQKALAVTRCCCCCIVGTRAGTRYRNADPGAKSSMTSIARCREESCILFIHFLADAARSDDFFNFESRQ